MIVSADAIKVAFRSVLSDVDFQGITTVDGPNHFSFNTMYVTKFNAVLTLALQQTHAHDTNFVHVLAKVKAADLATHALHPNTAPTAQAEFMKPDLIAASSFDVCASNYANHLQHNEYNRALVVIIGKIYRECYPEHIFASVKHPDNGYMGVLPCQYHALVTAAATPTPLSDITDAVAGWHAPTFNPADPTSSLVTTFFQITEAAKVAKETHAPFDKGMVILDLMTTIKATPLHCDPNKHLSDAAAEWEDGTNPVTASSPHTYGTFDFANITNDEWDLFMAHFIAADAHRLRDLKLAAITAAVAAPSYGAPPGYAPVQTTILPYEQMEGDFSVQDGVGPSDDEIASDNALAARNAATAERNEARERRLASERRLAASTRPTTSAAATWTPGSVPTGSKRIASLAARGGRNGRGKGDRSVRCPYDNRTCRHCDKYPAYGHVYNTWEHTEASCSQNPNRNAALYGEKRS